MLKGKPPGELIEDQRVYCSGRGCICSQSILPGILKILPKLVVLPMKRELKSHTKGEPLPHTGHLFNENAGTHLVD